MTYFVFNTLYSPSEAIHHLFYLNFMFCGYSAGGRPGTRATDTWISSSFQYSVWHGLPGIKFRVADCQRAQKQGLLDIVNASVVVFASLSLTAESAFVH